MSDTPIVVWTEVPVTDIDRATAFYNNVFDWNMSVETSPNGGAMAVFGGQMQGAGGHLHMGTPGKGPIVHISLPDTVEAGAERCRAAGGKVTGEPVQLPSGRFVYATDTEGNAIGLYEAA